MTADVQHCTLVFERILKVPPARVFEAYADPAQRARWGVASDTAVLIYDIADFRAGGIDRFRCGSQANPNIQGMATYLSIVPEHRIVWSEIIEMDGHGLGASLNTVVLESEGGGTRLISTVQAASFVGAEMIKGFETGTAAALDNLVHHCNAA